ncbi:hypothetical protein PF007_g15527 [Phytophthora fragariae]|uniref:Uncharacterized protein n=1 Tax=Phytophthora fragariae TaxID=53985 RepID=A0A6A3RU61_9STRA|nr:hypothetical protein PF007_g15527 [Phytophthora fragariae]
MKAKSNAKMMTRKHERLLEQRRRQHVRLLEQQASEDVAQQLRVRRHGETTVSSWWRSADDDDGTKRDTTYWSSSYGSHAVPSAIMMSTLMPTTTPRDGCRSRSTTAGLTPAELWNTLAVEKACDGCEVRVGLRVVHAPTRELRGPEEHHERLGGARDEDRGLEGRHEHVGTDPNGRSGSGLGQGERTETGGRRRSSLEILRAGEHAHGETALNGAQVAL